MFDHKSLEAEILDFWKKKKIYEQQLEKNKEGKPFYFCDGPPYATGQIHPGTAWNKTMKDNICRYWRMKGYNVRAQAGFDTHGLPIEVKVEKEMNIQNKQQIEDKGIDKFINACKDFATKYIEIMSNQFLSLGVWMDFNNPYITYKDSFIDSSWKTIQMAQEKGLLSEGFYVLPYCYRCETTMANYELEYGEESDPSVYVKFKVKDSKENEHLIIWTTTPWTLPLNMAVMVHPTLPYVRVKIGDEVWIVAKARLDHIQEVTGESLTVLSETTGKRLDGIRYEHPFQDKIDKQYDRRVILSDEAVTTEEGTGLVHSSTGTGPIDFIVGKRYGIECYCPIDGRGNYTEDLGGTFAGKNVKSSNIEIIQLMHANGSLIKSKRIKHRYPHCWRCKTPLIFRATNQWFIEISKTKDKMLEEAEKTDWYPDFAKQRFKEFVTGAPDWCISRQRYWGIPLPIWKCECGTIKVIGSSAELNTKIKELHRPYVDKVTLDCPSCKKKMHRVPDVLDVWFDSGNAVWASLDEKDRKTFGEVADVIIEGQDQIRGWFYSLLGSGIVRYNQCSYKKVIMHGFFVDDKGEKMSKSVGNFIPIEEILEKYGADSFRLWGSTNAAWDELKFNWTELKKASTDLNILFNLVTFLERFYPKKKIKDVKFGTEDKWLLSRLSLMMKDFEQSFEAYDRHKSVKVLRDFIVEDLSRFYMKLAKDRISNESGDGALAAIYESVFQSLRLISIFCPFIAEHSYRKFYKKFEKEDSIFLFSPPSISEQAVDKSLEAFGSVVQHVSSVGLNLRQKAGIKLRWPVRTIQVETSSHEVKQALEAMGPVFLRLMNARELKIVTKAEGGDLVSEDFTDGKLYMSKELDEELYEEGIFNEVKRRIQMQRKAEELVESDKIKVSISGEKELLAMVEKQKTKLMKEVNAVDVSESSSKDMTEYEIDGRIVKIRISKAK
ncbi:MAG: isoleucine--tRNA ligase [Candidatus Micrarchaeota archaeon]